VTTQIINLSGYKFTPLTDLETWKAALLAKCAEQGVKGTILLAPEGLNLFIAGTRDTLEAVLTLLRTMPNLADFKVKESPSPRQPFKRMLVKIKKEIIAFGVDQVNPARHTAPKISAQQLKQWLDEGRPVTLLDTRNDYEVRVGTFQGAVVPHIWNFRDFPKAVRQLPAELKNQPVVMFCTGGIRCEKAGPFMELEGYTNILQLEGGILKYFEEVGGSHYDGECFVFDERVSVDAKLQPGSAVMCFNCQMPVTLEEQRDSRYVREKTCPHCFAGKPKGRGNTAALAGEASA
jgi:predicted sulfurtransferase